MEHLYNVIWADDNIQALLEDGRSLFERNGIQLIPFTNAQEAIGYLENNARFIDAIIVDAKFSKAGEAFDEEGKSFPGLSLFMRQLSGLRKTYGMPYPCWIYTGFGDLLLDKYDADDLAEFEGVIDKKSNYVRKDCRNQDGGLPGPPGKRRSFLPLHGELSGKGCGEATP